MRIAKPPPIDLLICSCGEARPFAVLLVGFVVLLACITAHAAPPAASKQPNGIQQQQDWRAMRILHGLVQTEMRREREFALENVIERLSIQQGSTTFSNEPQEGVPSHDDKPNRFPTQKPDGVSADEWRALRNKPLDARGENGDSTYTLIDLDGDGLRDLVVNSYSGGTSLGSVVHLLKRKEVGFEGHHPDRQAVPTDADPPPFYTLIERGANQDATWIKLDGRVYAAYLKSSYGQDSIHLLRPFTTPSRVPVLTLYYRYSLALSAKSASDGRPAPAISQPLRRGINQVLRKLSAPNAQPGDLPLCPIPKGVRGNDQLEYTSYGAGHYTHEVVADVGLWQGGRCRIARIASHFGRYERKEKLFAWIWVRPSKSSGEEVQYDLFGQRQAVRLRSGWDPWQPWPE